MIDSLSDQELQTLADAPFTSGMNEQQLQALPRLPCDVGRPDFVPDNYEPGTVVSNDPTLPSRSVPDTVASPTSGMSPGVTGLNAAPVFVSPKLN